MAWVMYAGGQFHGVWGPQFEAGPPLEGGPAWVRSDTYQITAKAEGAATRENMSGPMLQALLPKTVFSSNSIAKPETFQSIYWPRSKGSPKLTSSKPGRLLFNQHRGNQAIHRRRFRQAKSHV